MHHKNYQHFLYVDTFDSFSVEIFPLLKKNYTTTSQQAQHVDQSP